MHYIVVRDDVYKEYERQLTSDKAKANINIPKHVYFDKVIENMYKLEKYQKVIKLTQLRFEFEPKTFSDTAESRPEAAQKMIAASIFASKLSLK